MGFEVMQLPNWPDFDASKTSKLIVLNSRWGRTQGKAEKEKEEGQECSDLLSRFNELFFFFNSTECLLLIWRMRTQEHSVLFIRIKYRIATSIIKLWHMTLNLSFVFPLSMLKIREKIRHFVFKISKISIETQNTHIRNWISSRPNSLPKNSVARRNWRELNTVFYSADYLCKENYRPVEPPPFSTRCSKWRLILRARRCINISCFWKIFKKKREKKTNWIEMLENSFKIYNI